MKNSVISPLRSEHRQRRIEKRITKNTCLCIWSTGAWVTTSLSWMWVFFKPRKKKKKENSLSIFPGGRLKKKINNYTEKVKNVLRKYKVSIERERIHLLVSISCVACHYFTSMLFVRFQVYTRWIVSIVRIDRATVRLCSDDTDRCRQSEADHQCCQSHRRIE